MGIANIRPVFTDRVQLGLCKANTNEWQESLLFVVRVQLWLMQSYTKIMNPQ